MLLDAYSFSLAVLLDAYSLPLATAAATGRATDVVDLKVELWIKLVLDHTPVAYQAVVGNTQNRRCIQKRNLKSAYAREVDLCMI